MAVTYKPKPQPRKQVPTPTTPWYDRPFPRYPGELLSMAIEVMSPTVNQQPNPMTITRPFSSNTAYGQRLTPAESSWRFPSLNAAAISPRVYFPGVGVRGQASSGQAVKPSTPITPAVPTVPIGAAATQAQPTPTPAAGSPSVIMFPSTATPGYKPARATQATTAPTTATQATPATAVQQPGVQPRTYYQAQAAGATPATQATQITPSTYLSPTTFPGYDASLPMEQNQVNYAYWLTINNPELTYDQVRALATGTGTTTQASPWSSSAAAASGMPAGMAPWSMATQPQQGTQQTGGPLAPPLPAIDYLRRMNWKQANEAYQLGASSKKEAIDKLIAKYGAKRISQVMFRMRGLENKPGLLKEKLNVALIPGGGRKNSKPPSQRDFDANSWYMRLVNWEV